MRHISISKKTLTSIGLLDQEGYISTSCIDTSKVIKDIKKDDHGCYRGSMRGEILHFIRCMNKTINKRTNSITFHAGLPEIF